MKSERSISNWLVLGLFILLSFAAFGLSIRNGFLGDDSHLLLKNALIHSISNWQTFFSGGAFYSGGAAKLAGFYYKPLLLTTLATLYSFLGPNSGAFHLFQVFLHALNGFLIFCLLKKFFPRKTAFAMGLLFLVHPANVEAVVYVSGIQEPLFLFFGIIALLARIYFPVNWRSNILVGLTLLLSVLSKETGVLFVLMVFLYDFLYEARKSLWHDLGILLGMVAIYSYLRFYVAGIFWSNQAVAPIMTLGIFGRLMTIPKIFWVSIETIIFPKELAFAQNWIVSKPDLGNFWLPVGLLVSFVLTGLIFVINQRKNLSANKGLVFFGLWFIFGIGMHLQILPLDGTFSERWLYFPLVGFFGLLGIFVEKVLIKSRKNFLAVMLGVILLAFVIRDIYRTHEWRDQFTLYSTDVEKRGGSFILYNGMAQELSDRNELEQAQKYANKSIAVFPIFLNWNNLGVILSKKGDYPEAIAAFNHSLEVGPYYLAYEKMVGTYLLWGKNAEAIKNAEYAMQMFPGNSKLVVFWTAAKYKMGDRQAAINGAVKAFQMDPSPETKYVWETVNAGTEINLGN